MRLKIRCPNAECGKVLVVDDKLAGQKGKCSTCGSKFVIPAPPAPAAPTPSAPTAKPAGGEKPKPAAPPGAVKAAGPSASSTARKPSAPPIPPAANGERRTTQPPRSPRAAGAAGAAGAAPQRPKRPAADEEMISADELSDFLIEDDDPQGPQAAAADFEDYEDYEATGAAADYEVDDFDEFDAPAPRGKRTAKPRDDFDDFDDYDTGDELSEAEDYDDYDDEPRSRRSGGRAGGRSRGKPARKRSGSGGSLAKAGTGVLLLLINAYATLVFMIMLGVLMLFVLLTIAAPEALGRVLVVVAIVTLVSGLAVFAGQFCQLAGYIFTVQAPDRGNTRTLAIVLLVGASIRVLLFLGIFGTNWASLSGLDRGDLRNPAMALHAFSILAVLGMFAVFASVAAELILCPMMLGSLNEQADRRGTVGEAEAVRNIGIFLAAGMVAPFLLGLFAGLVPALAGVFAILLVVLQLAMLVLWFVYLFKLIALMKDTRYNIT